MKPRRIILAGGGGFLGRLLIQAFAERGDEVVLLTRRPGASYSPARALYWDGRTLGDWAVALEGADAVINLAGKNVNCRYTPAALTEINASRVDSVRVLADAIKLCRRPPAVWVQSGSLAVYGDAKDRPCDENAPAGQGIPAEVCVNWERAFAGAATPDTRQVLLRISFVLGRSGGALPFLETLVRCFLGGPVAGGSQYISWIHEEDMVRLFLRAVDDASMSGTYNATGPEPATNATFMRELRSVLHRPWSPPLPAWAVRIGCWLMRTEPVLSLTGRRGIPRRLQDEGFAFNHPRLPEALNHLYTLHPQPIA